MADLKITELTELEAPTTDDLVAMVDSPASSPITKKVTVANLLATSVDGWMVAGESWTSPSFADTNGESTLTVTVPTDATTKYQAGMRVKFTQDATERFGIITKVAATELTIFIDTDYTPTGNAITLPFFSMMKTPFGFDGNPIKWRVITTSTALSQQVNPTASVWYNVGSLSITVPIGAWEVYYKANMLADSDSDEVATKVTLSTASNSESDKAWTTQFYGKTLDSTAVWSSTRKGRVALTTADVFYLNISTDKTIGAGKIIAFYGTESTIVIEATCAYL